MSDGSPLFETRVHKVQRCDVATLGLPYFQLPLTSAEPISDHRPSHELVASLALQRAHRGGLAKSDDHYFDHGRLTPSYLTRALDELASSGLLALVDEDPWGLRRVSLTDAGHDWYAQLNATPRRTALRIPEPMFPTKAPAGRCPALLPSPGGQPNPTCPTEKANVQQLRWARCPDDEHLHLLHPADVVAAATQVTPRRSAHSEYPLRA